MVQIPCIGSIDLVLDTSHFVVDFLHRVFIKRFGTLRTQVVVFLKQVATIGDRVFDVLPDVLLWVQLWLLRQVAGSKTLGKSRFSIEFFVDASHDLQQRTFSRSVAAEHANFRSRKERQMDVLERFFLTMLLGHARHLKDVLLTHDFTLCKNWLIFDLDVGGLLEWLPKSYDFGYECGPPRRRSLRPSRREGDIPN